MSGKIASCAPPVTLFVRENPLSGRGVRIAWNKSTDSFGDGGTVESDHPAAAGAPLEVR